MEPNLAVSIYVRSSINFLHFVPFHQQIWPPRAILVSDWLLFKKIFSSETAWQNGAKLGRKHLCKVQTWHRWSLGVSLSKLCSTAPPSIQDGCCFLREWLSPFEICFSIILLSGECWASSYFLVLQFFLEVKWSAINFVINIVVWFWFYGISGSQLGNKTFKQSMYSP